MTRINFCREKSPCGPFWNLVLCENQKNILMIYTQLNNTYTILEITTKCYKRSFYEQMKAHCLTKLDLKSSSCNYSDWRRQWMNEAVKNEWMSNALQVSITLKKASNGSAWFRLTTLTYTLPSPTFKLVIWSNFFRNLRSSTWFNWKLRQFFIFQKSIPPLG